MATVQKLHVLAQAQDQPAEASLAFQTNQMLGSIDIVVVHVEKNTRRVVQSDVRSLTFYNRAVANRDRWLNRDIPIRLTNEMREKYVVVVNAANCQANATLKMLGRRRNAGRPAGNFFPTCGRRRR